jgi:hypothetical protein
VVEPTGRGIGVEAEIFLSLAHDQFLGSERRENSAASTPNDYGDALDKESSSVPGIQENIHEP